MKRYILAWCSLCLLIGLLSSCNEDGKNGFPTGILYLNVEEDATMLTKAENAVTYESLQVAILQGEEDAQDTVKVFNDYLKDVKSQRLILPIGKYTIAVRSNGIEGAGWETPLYMGQEEVEVKQGEITNTKVVCTIANTKVSVIYENALKDYFTDYQTTVSNPSGTLLYTRDEYRSGFFTPEKLTVQLKLVNKDGNEFVMKKVYPEIEPQYHYKFIYSISNDDTSDQGGFNVDIDVDKNLQEITYNIFIKKEELAGAGQPSAKLSSEFNDGTYTFKRTDETPNPAPNSIWLDYTLGSNNALQSFIVTMDSPILGKSRFDITKREGSEIGFPALPDSPVDKSDSRYVTYRMDLTDIVTHLGCQDNQPTIHNFTVDLLDDKFQETSITFAIKMMPDVAAYVENPICWTTFAVLKGFCSDESCYFKLQVGDEESTIKNIPAVNKDGKVSALVVGLKAGTTYKYRIASEVDVDMKCDLKSFTIQEFVEIPNLGFEDWSERTKSKISGFGGTFMTPNTSGSPIYWDSGNWGASAAGMTLTNSTDIKATNNSTTAALLKSQYAAKDLAILGKYGAFAAGSVFAGEAQSVSTSGATLSYGQKHNGYPTFLKGYYKYTPGTIDFTDTKDRTPAGVKKGDTDQCFIYVALGTKPLDVISTTSEIKVFNKDREGIFAYGEYITTKTENLTGELTTGSILNGYAPFKIPLIYTAVPPEDSEVYLFIVATASRYGDYFTGSTSSELYIDEFSLDYNYDAECFKGTEFENMSPININDK